MERTALNKTKYNARVNIMMTERDRDMLIKLAEAQQITVSELIRQQIRILTSAAQAVISHHSNTGAAA